MTTKKELVLENMPTNKSITIQELIVNISDSIGMRYERHTIKKTLELLRKEGKVKEVSHAGRGHKDTFIRRQ